MTDFGPCRSWDPIWPCDVSTQSPSATGTAVDVATYVLWSLTGRQFDTCQVTVRPCREDCTEFPWRVAELGWTAWPGGDTWPRPALIGGLWYNLTCGSCGDGCACTRLSVVRLPAPVLTVDVVRVDGAPLATGAYRVDDNRLLVRTDGGEWPRCNDLTRADTQAGTWSVTATYGQPVPELGRVAVGELACEVLRALRGEDCRLPKGLQSLARQGVTIQFQNADELLNRGLLGLRMCDLFVTSTNPAHLHRRAGTYRVDAAAPRRVGT